MKLEFANEAVEVVEVENWSPSAVLFGYKEISQVKAAPVVFGGGHVLLFLTLTGSPRLA